MLLFNFIIQPFRFYFLFLLNMTTRKTLLWIREQLSKKESKTCIRHLQKNQNFFTVIFQDPREVDFAPDYENMLMELNWLKPEMFCEKLMSEKIDFCRFINRPEKIIPSIAWVVRTVKVMTQPLKPPAQSTFPELTDFRNRRAGEVHYLMKMHSIPMEFELPWSAPLSWHGIFGNSGQLRAKS